jgi:hypothetical protein
VLSDETYTGGLRDLLAPFRAGSMFILDEAHHAAPSSGATWAVESQMTKAVRDIAALFEHRLFLSATPHNGHSNSFATLLEILDPQRFTCGIAVEARDLEPGWCAGSRRICASSAMPSPSESSTRSRSPTCCRMRPSCGLR